MNEKKNQRGGKRNSVGDRFAGASDTAGIVVLVAFVLIVFVGALAIVQGTDRATDTDAATALAESDVVMPSDSDLFSDENRRADESSRSAMCGPGRIDLLTADEDAINAVRGLRQPEVAELVVLNREFLAETADLVRIGVSDALVSRILLSREVCIGEIAPDDDLPDQVCVADDLDINTAFPTELVALEGIDEAQAKILVDSRPFQDVLDIVSVEGIAERTITWLSLNGTCLRQIESVDNVPSVSTPCSERVDLSEATIEEISDVRGLYQIEAAEIVAANQDTISSIDDLLELGLDAGRIGRLIASHEACFGQVNLDEELPTAECKADELDLNNATIIELLDLDGITHDMADLIVAKRPFAVADAILTTAGLPESALVSLAVGDTCLGAQEVNDGLCGAGRIDIQTASLFELVQMRGSRQQSVATTLFESQAEIESLADLLDLGIHPIVAGKILSSLQSCFGDNFPEDDLPSTLCRPLGVDLNSADITQLVSLTGLTHLQADLIVANRPYADPGDLLDVEGLAPETITSLAVLDTCIEPFVDRAEAG